MLRVLIADDELQARKRLVRLIEALPDVEIVSVCESGDEVLQGVLSARPDVLVLDISMPGRTGLELRAALPHGPSVIFVTAHREHAIAAFDLGATDYVLKPVTAARLEQALARARTRRSASPAPPSCDRIPIETRTGVLLIEPASIVYASFDGALVSIVTAAGTVLTTATLRELETRLAKLVRVDRRHLLNLDEVARLEPEPDGGSVAVTRGGHRVPVSRQATRELRRRLGF